MQGKIVSEFRDQELQLKEIINAFESTGTVLYRGRNTVKIFKHHGLEINIKRFKIPNTLNKFVYRFFRKSKAQRSFEYAQILENNKIGTPFPIAYFEEKTALTFQYSYYISEHVNADFTFRALIHEDLKDKEHIIKRYTQFIFNMHEAGIYFLDNSPGNTLIKKESHDISFFLVDLNRMKFYNIPKEDRLRNFERLAPVKWIYNIMGEEYARLAGYDIKETINSMWQFTTEFQEKFHRKKRFKESLKSFFGKKV